MVTCLGVSTLVHNCSNGSRVDSYLYQICSESEQSALALGAQNGKNKPWDDCGQVMWKKIADVTVC